MPETEAKRSPKLRRRAGVWMVVLALGLALLGVIFALQQARATTLRLAALSEGQMARAEQEVRERLVSQLSTALEAIRASAPAPEESWRRPAPVPEWLSMPCLWDMSGVRPFTSDPALDSHLLDALNERLRVVSNSVQPAHRVPGFGVFHLPDPKPAKLFVFQFAHSDDASPSAILARLDMDALQRELASTVLPPSSGIELVSLPGAQGDWSHQLSGSLRFLALRSTEAYLRSQRNAVLGQTLVYLGLTWLAVVTLLVAMWFLNRVSRREVALAELKANFVADVSHELKTPLALIHMFAETLLEGRVASDDKRREYYQIILRESTRLTNLINNILDFAKIEAGKREYRLEPTDVALVVRETYESYAPQLDRNGFERHLTIESALPVVLADRDAVAQALVNLLSNAIKYCGDERYVAIDVTRDVRRGRPGVLISIHDRGIGIRPEDRARLTEGFFRAADGRVLQQGGTGLGLSLVKHIVDAHQGALDVESRLVRGSTFRIFLPETPEVRSARSVPSEPGSRASGSV